MEVYGRQWTKGAADDGEAVVLRVLVVILGLRWWVSVCGEEAMGLRKGFCGSRRGCGD